MFLNVRQGNSLEILKGLMARWTTWFCIREEERGGGVMGRDGACVFWVGGIRLDVCCLVHS